MSKIEKALRVARRKRKKFAEGGKLTMDDIPTQPGEPLIGNGGVFSEGVPWANKAAKIGSILGSNIAYSPVTVPYHIVKNMVEGSKEYGQTGELSPKSIEGAGDLIMTGVGSAAGIRPTEGVLHAFAGVKSKNLDKGALSVAQAAEREGLSPKDIYDKTGFFKGIDNRWRYEIDDSGAVLKPLSNGSASYLNNVLDHPELYKAYPGMENIRVKVPGHYPENGAAWDGSSIIMGNKAAQDKGILMHEIQHAIQDFEGFPKGGEPGKHASADKSYKLTFDDDVSKLRRPYLDLQSKARSGETLSAKEQAQLDYLQHIFDRYNHYTRAGDAKAVENYLALAGETEARNVQTRTPLEPIERTKSYPLDTEDTARSQQIVAPLPIRTNPYLKPGEIPREAINDTKNYAGGGGVGFDPMRRVSHDSSLQGAIRSSVPGRTDKINANVPAGSSIVPADVVSALGQGNTEAGFSALGSLIKKGPYGMNIPKAKAGMRVGPRRSSRLKMGFAEGGEIPHTPIVVAGGEYAFHPEEVMQIGGGDLDLGHEILNKFYEHVRKTNIQTLKGLKGPKNG